MRLGLLALMLGIIAFAGIERAEARPYYEEIGYGVERWGNEKSPKARTAHRSRTAHRTTTKRYASVGSGRRYSGVGPRPGRWCGWWMRTQLGGGPEYNLARNWRKYGRAVSGPQVGAVVVWSGHVGMITGRASNGQWIVKSGNDGGRVRERARSVAGAVFRVG